MTEGTSRSSSISTRNFGRRIVDTRWVNERGNRRRNTVEPPHRSKSGLVARNVIRIFYLCRRDNGSEGCSLGSFFGTDGWRNRPSYYGIGVREKPGIAGFGSRFLTPDPQIPSR